MDEHIEVGPSPELDKLSDEVYDRWKGALELLGKEDWENEDN